MDNVVHITVYVNKRENEYIFSVIDKENKISHLIHVALYKKEM